MVALDIDNANEEGHGGALANIAAPWNDGAPGWSAIHLQPLAGACQRPWEDPKLDWRRSAGCSTGPAGFAFWAVNSCLGNLWTTENAYSFLSARIGSTPAACAAGCVFSTFNALN